MNNFEGVGVLEVPGLEKVGIQIKENLDKFNKAFRTTIKPENGAYGVQEIDKGNGLVERIGKDANNHLFKEYFQDGKLIKIRKNLGEGKLRAIEFDDNGVDYLQIDRAKDSQGILKVTGYNLKPNVTIQKGNFSSVIDAYGRPVLNKVTDLRVRAMNESRKPLTIEKDSSYRQNDHRGHLIADSLGGTSTRENIVAQLDNVNQGKMARVENIVRGLKADGHTVDYEVKANYVGTKDARPSSFEPKITVDGKEYTELPDDLKKIYNSSTDNRVTGLSTNIAERYGVTHEISKKSAVLAAGITATISTTENVSAFINGAIDAEEMVTEIVTDTAAAGGIAYGSTFISTAVSQTMSKSSSALIQKVGGSCAPAAVVSFAVTSYDEISDYAQGKIDALELAYDLGDNAASVAGGLAGAQIGATIGTAAGPVGTVAGGVVGGVVGCVIASEAYETAVELGQEGAEILAKTANELASNVIESVAENVPGALDDVKTAFSDFSSNVSFKFNIG